MVSWLRNCRRGGEEQRFRSPGLPVCSRLGCRCLAGRQHRECRHVGPVQDVWLCHTGSPWSGAAVAARRPHASGPPRAHRSALAGSSQPLAARPRVPSGLGAAEDVRIAAMAQRVKEVLPHVPLEVIKTDLGKRRWGASRAAASPSLPGL